MSRLVLALALLLAAPAFAAANAGFLYGTLTTDKGLEHTGFLRWESEEAYWDDLFHSRQTDARFFDYIDLKILHDERKKKYFAEHGLFDRLMWTMQNRDDRDKPTRLFTVRFGDLAAIDVDHREETITVTLNDGREVGVWGYANDVSSDVYVYGTGEEPEIVEWDDIARIAFAPAPPETEPYAHRIHAVVNTRTGDPLEGFLMWDESECTTIDVIDADEGDVAFGDIRRMVKRDEGGSEATMHDGEVLVLTGTNDVDRGHRGVFVEVPEVGRVAVEWKDFDDAVFVTDRGSGPGRDAYPAIRELHGTVTDTEGVRHAGRLVHDLDEAWTCDILDGRGGKRTYEIPFLNVAAITKTGDEDGIRVRLRSGASLDLEGFQDTGQTHAGYLIFPAEGGEPVHVPWSRFRTAEFTP
jgi:hypothetical protein